jgi:HEAT repeat protein
VALALTARNALNRFGDETMDRSEDIAHQVNSVGNDDARSATITSLVADLASSDELVRTDARQSLVDIGGPAVFPLIEALGDPRRQVRWEATKALGEIANPAAAPALVKTLRDTEFSVRWLAAEGLIALGSKGLRPLLRALIEYSDSVWLRQGAHHVVHDLARGDLKEVLQPVVAALQGIEPSLEAPLAARAALDALTEVTWASSETR